MIAYSHELNATKIANNYSTGLDDLPCMAGGSQGIRRLFPHAFNNMGILILIPCISCSSLKTNH